MSDYPVAVQVVPVTEGRNRLTTFFRFFLSIPHLLLVGGPAVSGLAVRWTFRDGLSTGVSGGLLGFIVCLTTVVLWVAIVITARHIDGLWEFGANYMRWRVRAVAYLMLLRDEYPPFSWEAGRYPVELQITMPQEPRDRLTVFFRFLMALPHLFVLALIYLLWSFATAVAWVVILLTGRYPETLYGFSLGALAWTTRVEAYILMLRDEYPPFTLRV